MSSTATIGKPENTEDVRCFVDPGGIGWLAAGDIPKLLYLIMVSALLRVSYRYRHASILSHGFPACLSILPILSGINLRHRLVSFFVYFFLSLLPCFCFYAVVGAFS